MRALIFFFMTIAALASIQGAAVADRPAPPEVWTVVIDYPAFADYVYTWRLKRDGSYEEDGASIADGEAIQRTQHGAWTREGSRMVLTQAYDAYRFEGVVRGGQYSGDFYSGPMLLSKFCAWKGRELPASCDTDLVG